MFNKLKYLANPQPGVPVGLKAGRKRTIPYSSTSLVPATRPRPGPNSGSPSTSVSKTTAASRNPTPGPEGNIRKTTVTAGQPSTSSSHTRLNVTPCDSNPAVSTMPSTTGTGQAIAGRKYQKAWQVNRPWLRNDYVINNMFSDYCVQYQHICHFQASKPKSFASESNFIDGTANYFESVVTDHEKSSFQKTVNTRRDADNQLNCCWENASADP